MAITRSDVDITALRRQLAETAEEIRGLKKALRQTWTREMAPEQRRLEVLKIRATMLCVLRALLRGRFHLARRSPADHEKIALRAIERLGLAAPPIAMGGAA